jgi:hypothetical protein
MVFVMLRDTENTAEDAKAAIVDEDLKYDSFKTIYVTKDFKITLQDINTELDIRWRTDISDESQSGNYLRWWADKVTPPPPATGNHPQITKATCGAVGSGNALTGTTVYLNFNNNMGKRIFNVGISVELTTIPTEGSHAGEIRKENSTNGGRGTAEAGSTGWGMSELEFEYDTGLRRFIPARVISGTATIKQYSYTDDNGNVVVVRIPEDEWVVFNITRE